MAFVINDRVRATSTSTGTGVMAGMTTVPGYQSFAFVPSPGDTVPYAIVCADTGQWETGLGSYSGTTLTRTAVITSSNADLPVDFGVGTKDIFCTIPAALMMTTNGGIFNAHIQVPAGGSGAQVPRVQDVGALTVSQRADVYRRGNALGAVSQSGGVPTGAIAQVLNYSTAFFTERAVRYLDGTQITTIVGSTRYTTSTPTGNIYTHGPSGIPFVTPFAVRPVVSVSTFDSSTYPCWCSGGSPTTSSINNIYLFSPGPTGSASIEATAIGRWF